MLTSLLLKSLLLNLFAGLFPRHVVVFTLACVGLILCRWIPNASARIFIRGGLVSIAISPSFYGHAGIVPAIWAVFYPPVAGEIDLAAILALLIIWALAILLLYGLTKATR